MRPAVVGSILALSSTVLVASTVAWVAGVGGTPRYDLGGPEVVSSTVTPRSSVPRMSSTAVPGPADRDSGEVGPRSGADAGADPIIVAAVPGAAAPAAVSSDASAPSAPSAPSAAAPAAVSSDASARGPQRPLPAPGRPVDIRIPSLGMQAGVVAVGLDPDGSMTIPPPSKTGWFEPGVRVGSAYGSAVIAGHVDSRGRPGAFIGLRSLELGAEIIVTDDAGTSHRFEVTERFQVDKLRLPVTELFRRDGDPVLTLITCGGEFRRRTRHYTDNIVIRAVPVPRAPAQPVPAPQAGAAGVGSSAVTPAA